MKQLWSIPLSIEESPLCLYYTERQVHTVSTNEAIAFLRHVVEAIGKDRLGYYWSKVGLHSICSAAAMAMFLDNTLVFLIMLIGW